MTTPNRTIKTKVPARVIVTSLLIGLFVVGFILFAVWQSGVGLHEARMSGTIVSKEFKPYEQPETQITLNRSGTVSTQNTEGQFILTVDVPQKNGSPKRFTVWLNDKRTYDKLKVGDTFDVGPYVVPSE